MPLQLNMETYRAVLEALPIGVYVVDRDRRIVFWNQAAGSISGYLGQEVIGHLCPDNILMHCDENHRSLCGEDCPLAHTMHDGRPRDADVFLRHKEGHRLPVRVRSVPIRNESEVIVGSAEFFEERSFRAGKMKDRRSVDEKPADSSIEVADSRAMRAAFETAIEQWAGSEEPFGVLCMIVDNLEHLRHVYGCQAINAILAEAAETIAGSIRPADMAGRWQDNRFAMLVACPTSAALQSCAHRLKRLVGLTAVPWWGDRISMTISMGGTMVRAGDTVDSLMARAAAALEASQAQQADSVLVV